jgi:hypothetical protein
VVKAAVVAGRRRASQTPWLTLTVEEITVSHPIRAPTKSDFRKENVVVLGRDDAVKGRDNAVNNLPRAANA